MEERHEASDSGVLLAGGPGKKGCVCVYRGGASQSWLLTTLEKQPGLLEGMEVLGRIVHLKSQGLLSLYIFLSLAPIYEGHAQ